MKRIGIVVTTYNTARYVEETLRSVLAQTLGAWSLVVVDDGSQDDSAQIAETLLAGEPRAKVVRTENHGVSHARNRGVAELPDDVQTLAILDSDDVWEPEALQVLAAALDTSASCVAAVGWAAFIGPEGQAVEDPLDPLLTISARDGWRRPADPRTWALERTRLGPGGIRLPLPYPEPTDLASLLADNRIVSPGVALIRAEAFRDVGGFRQEASPREDWDLWIRLAPHGPIQPVDSQVLRYRVRGDNASLNMANSNRAQAAIEEFLENWDWLRAHEPELLDSWFDHRQRQALEDAAHRGRLIRAGLRRGRFGHAAAQVGPLAGALRRWARLRRRNRG